MYPTDTLQQCPYIDLIDSAFEEIKNADIEYLHYPHRYFYFQKTTKAELLYKLYCTLNKIEYNEDDEFKCQCCSADLHILNRSSTSINDEPICINCFYYVKKHFIKTNNDVVMIDREICELTKHEEKCPICLEDKYCYAMYHECDHTICLDCVIQMDEIKCHYRCQK